MVAWRRVSKHGDTRGNRMRGGVEAVACQWSQSHHIGTIPLAFSNGSWLTVVQQWWYGLVEYLWRKMRLLKRITTALAMLHRICHGSPE